MAQININWTFGGCDDHWDATVNSDWRRGGDILGMFSKSGKSRFKAKYITGHEEETELGYFDTLQEAKDCVEKALRAKWSKNGSD